MSSSNTLLLTTFVSLAVFAALTSAACNPETDRGKVTLEYKILFSDVVVYGLPRHRVKDTRYPNRDVYTVTFEVRCIFKGAPLPEMIEVQKVGMNDRLCNRTEYPTDAPSLIYLKKLSSDRFTPTYKEDPGEEQFLEEVPVICTTIVEYPIGYSLSNRKEKCPDAWDDPNDCIALPTIEPPTGHKMDDMTYSPDSSDDGKYDRVQSGDEDTNTEVKIGDKANKDGGKKSENLEQQEGGDEIKPKTPGGGASDNKTSVVTFLCGLVMCALLRRAAA